MSEMPISIPPVYTVFEPDQVLTHDQLNGLASFFDRQDRLTRVNLLGIGIACGLEVSRSSNGVTVKHGAGVTSAGDLLVFDPSGGSQDFSFYKPYPPPADWPPKTTVYELVASPAGAMPLSSLPLTDDHVALLYLESRLADDDLCSVTDCDNLGKELRQNLRVLLVDNQTGGKLAAGHLALLGPTQSISIHEEFPTVRARVPKEPVNLLDLYKAPCNAMKTAFETALAEGRPYYNLFKELSGADPKSWLKSLSGLHDAWIGSFAIQYYYDFLKDLAETYDGCRNFLFGDRTLCCPPPDAFAKHLMLGTLRQPVANRCPFFPSGITSQTAERIDHARFLARKFGRLIESFHLLPGNLPNQHAGITPSRTESASLEDRAIPFYYRISENLRQSWSWEASRRGFHGAILNFEHDALGRQLGRYDFFRIEGFLGKSFMPVLDTLSQQIEAYNLPFQIRAVQLGTRPDLVSYLPPFYYELHDLQQLELGELVDGLNQAAEFGDLTFARASREIVPAENQRELLLAKTQANNAELRTNVSRTVAELESGIGGYQSGRWLETYDRAVTAAGNLQADLGPIASSSFPTAIDNFLSHSPVPRMVKLDRLIEGRNELEKEKYFFKNFRRNHPELEHFGGAARGGALVLIYDPSGIIVGDLSLPYLQWQEADLLPDPPSPQPPIDFHWPIRPESFPIAPMTLPTQFQYFEVGVEDKIVNSRHYFNEELTNNLTRTSGIVSGMLSGFNQEPPFNPQEPPFFPRSGDKLLDLQVKGLDTRLELIKELRSPGGAVDPSRAELLADQLNAAELDLARAAGDAARYVAAAKLDASPGAPAFRSVVTISEALIQLKSPAAIDEAAKKLDEAFKAQPDLKKVLPVLSNRKKATKA